MGTKTIRGSLLSEDLPQNIVRVLIATRSKSNDVAAYLMLEFVQAFEGSTLLLSWWMKPEPTTMNCKVAGNKGEKNLLVGVCQGQVPISQVVVLHAGFSCLLLFIGLEGLNRVFGDM
jgi:hypothetical protein